MKRRITVALSRRIRPGQPAVDQPPCAVAAPPRFTIVDVTLAAPPTHIELADVVRDRAERTFGQRADPMLLERYARDAARDVLSVASPRLYTFLPDLALREVRDALDRNAA